MSFTFNGIDSKTYLITNTVRQSILPPLASKMVSVPKRAGALDFGVELGVRQIEVSVTMSAASYEELRTKARQMADWLYQEDLKPLLFSDESDKTYMARVSGETDIEEIVYTGMGTLLFLCPEPFATGQLVNQTVAVAKPEPTFTRTSAAYNDNGTAYAVNQPRYYAGQHGQAVKLEEGTTNLLQTAQAPAEESLSLTPGTKYTLSSEGTSQTVTVEHSFTDDLTTGTKSGTYTQGTELKLTVDPAFSHTETAQADFNGTHSNTVTTAGGTVELTKTAAGTNYNKTETTQADFQGGTILDVMANSIGELELATETVSSTTQVTKKATFEGGGGDTADGFFTFAGFTTSSAYSWDGIYSATTNTTATSNFAVPAGVTNAKLGFPYMVTSGTAAIYLNGSLIKSASAAPDSWLWINNYVLNAGTSYQIRWQSGSSYRIYIDDLLVSYNQTTNTTRYKLTGNRVSPAYDITSVGEVASSTISWTEVIPSASTSVKVEVTLDGGTTWTQCTNGGAIPGLPAGTLTSGKSIKWKITLSTSDQTKTPKVSDITVNIVAKDLYNTTGTYTSPALALIACTVMASTINWADVIPAGSGLTVETNYAPDGVTWAGWTAATKGGGILGLTNGTVINAGAKLQYRITLTPTTDQKQTPQLQDITLTVDKANTGTRTSPAFDLTNVETYYSSVISWTATVPAGASLTVETSVDGGATWNQATNGGAIPRLTAGQALSGKSVTTRATLKTLTANDPPTLHSLTLKMAAQKTGNTFSVTPATNQTILTPSGVTRWQLEQKAYKTTFTVGTREPETLTLNMGGGLDSTQGTFEVRAYEDGRTDRHAFLWDSYGTGSESRFLLKKLTDATYVLYFNNALAIKTTEIAAVGHHVFAARWNGNTVWFLIDGVEKGTATLAAPVDMSKNEKIYLGSSYNEAQHWNNTIDEVRASKTARTTSELLAHAIGGPLPLDENTSCLLAFDGNMGVGAIEYPSLTYNGTARTYPLFTLEIKAPMGYVKLMKGSKHILVTQDFVPGDVLVIDNDRGLIKLNGLRAMHLLDVSSDFFMLDRGLNEFSLEPASKCNVEIQYKEKWL